MDKEKLIELVRKLLALGDKDKNNSEAEANTAFSKAQAILRKHNIDMADVIIKDGEKVVDIKVEQEIVFDIKRNSLQSWTKTLMTIVGKATECRPFFTKKFTYPRSVWFQVGFVGTEWDRSIAKELYCYLYHTNIKLSRKFYPDSCSQQHWFLEGFCAKLWERVSEELTERKKDEAIHAKYALMVVSKDALVEQKMKELGFVKSKSRHVRNDNFDFNAYAMGQHEGSKVDLGTTRRIGANGSTNENYE